MESAPRVLPAHPGEVLKSDYLERLGISVDDFANEIGIPPERIEEILSGRRAISADTATRLGDRLRTTAQFWVTLQANYDLALVSRKWGRRSPNQPKLPRRRR